MRPSSKRGLQCCAQYSSYAATLPSVQSAAASELRLNTRLQSSSPISSTTCSIPVFASPPACYTPAMTLRVACPDGRAFRLQKEPGICGVSLASIASLAFGLSSFSRTLHQCSFKTRQVDLVPSHLSDDTARDTHGQASPKLLPFIKNRFSRRRTISLRQYTRTQSVCKVSHFQPVISSAVVLSFRAPSGLFFF